MNVFVNVYMCVCVCVCVCVHVCAFSASELRKLQNQHRSLIVEKNSINRERNEFARENKVCVCVCVCMCMYVCMCMCECVCDFN